MTRIGGYRERDWNAPPKSVPYPMEGEGPAHPAYMDAGTWLWRWEQLADRRCLDAELYNAYDIRVQGTEVMPPLPPDRRLPL